MKILVILLCFLLMTACGFPKPFTDPTTKKDISLKVINYNLWHGLGDGYFKREELEPEQNKNNRYSAQLKLLRSNQPDILFLQEVHPSASRAKSMANTLNMNAVYHQTNCGIALFDIGLPINLDIGIAILVKPPLKLKKILGLKLSGPPGFCNTWFTFQYGEFRYALFALAWHPDYGSFLLVTTHFHHGPEWSKTLTDKLSSWEDTGLLNSDQLTELKEAISESNQRREQELTKLFTQINEIREHYKDIPLILAGDFNSTVESPIYKSIIESHNLKDSVDNFSPTPYTWNPALNKENHRLTAKFKPPVPTFDKQEVQDFFKTYDRRPRRIDYVFVSPKVKVISHQLFANKPQENNIIPSDHFGVQVELTTGETPKENPKTNPQNNRTANNAN